MKKIVLLFGFILFWSFTTMAQEVFPTMEAETIKSEKIELPSYTKGKYTLLGMAYSKKSEKELKTWYQPVFDKFIQPKLKGGAGGLFNSFGYDIHTYFVPMFTGINAAAAGTAKKQALKKVDPHIQPYILFYKGKIKQFKESLGFETKDTPYFFLLDEEGKIIYQATGAYSSSKMSKIESNIDDF